MRARHFSLLALSMALMLPVPTRAADNTPVAAWTFNGDFRRLYRDVAAGRHHAVGHDDLPRAEAPGHQALVFDGVDDYVRAPDDPSLRMTDAVTVDVWLMLDEPDTGGPQCIVDKGGERYRI
ncbi:MAG: hypothetical protein ACP5KN_04345, partial [Armatimonadota bacterium]